MLKRLLLRAYERLALNAMATGRYARAERMLRRMERLEGTSRRVLHNLALVRLAQGDHDQAESYLLQEIEAYGEAPALLRALAETAYLSGDRDRAVLRIGAALADRDCPDRKLLHKRAELCADPAAHARAMAGKRDFAEGNALLARGDADGALAAFRRAVDADPSDFVALNNVGTLLLNHVRDRTAAARTFEQAAALSDQPLVRRNLEAAQADPKRR